MGLICIKTTSKCNLQCKYCFSESQNLDLDLKKTYEFIDHYSSNDNNKTHSAIITGGEPLMLKGIKEFCISLKQKINQVDILTNGILLDNEWLEFFQTMNMTIHVSLDSINSKYHEKYRGNFEETKYAVDRLCDYMDGIRHSISMTLSYENVEELYLMIEYTQKKGYQLDLNLLSLDSSKKLSWANANEDRVNLAIKGIDEWIKLTKRVSKGRLMQKMLLDNHFKMNICYSQAHNITIHPNGDIFPCFMNKERYYGNIYRDSYQKIMETEKNLSKHIDSSACFSLDCMGIYN